MNTAKQQYEAIDGLDREERDRLLKEQLPEVRYIAKRIHDRLPQHVLLEDLVHSGVLGLIDAFQKYNPGRQVQFRTYAKFRIRGAILDSLRELDWSPRDLRQKARRLEAVDLELKSRLGRPATELELASELGVSLESFQDLLTELRGLDLGSLQAAGPEDSIEPTESGPPGLGTGEPDAYALCLKSEMKALLADAIDELPEKEKQVLSLYYFDELTMKEIGAILGVTESRICQIHSTAMVRLRARMSQTLNAGDNQREGERARRGTARKTSSRAAPG